MEKDGRAAERTDVAAARRGGDPDQGMTDEPSLASSTVEQALFWRDVYAEILTMEDAVLVRVRELMLAESPTVRREVELSNLPVLTAQADRFRQRHAFWSERFDELSRSQPVAPVHGDGHMGPPP